jgi:predicted nucleotide-binding protein
LEQAAQSSDFAVLVFTADDSLRSRGKKHAAPRDNVVFELGLFMGASRRERTFMVVEKSKGIKFPSDLHGVTYLGFSRNRKSVFVKDIKDICAEIREKIMELKPK